MAWLGRPVAGSERRRIAIARALLKRPEILIFDEATSNLDDHAAESFAATINNLNGKVTILFIAHKVPKKLIANETIIVGVGSAPVRSDSSLDEVAERS